MSPKASSELERDLELERRKIHELQDASRDREKEYQKLKVCLMIFHAVIFPDWWDTQLQLDKFKRKALLAPHPNGHDNIPGFGTNSHEDQPRQQPLRPFGMGISGVSSTGVNFGTVVGGMEASGVCALPLCLRLLIHRGLCANKIQRTPLVNRTMPFPPQVPVNASTWGQQQPQHDHVRNRSHRQPFAASTERSYRSTTDQSDSANEVETILITNQNANRGRAHYGGWSSTPQQAPNVQGTSPFR
ncbi:hypothetical protein C0995_013089 [Termitomyces sp. Mi166|nr:hypothetical protein C0995_013089 [Termitomyces sp. Mi166\